MASSTHVSATSAFLIGLAIGKRGQAVGGESKKRCFTVIIPFIFLNIILCFVRARRHPALRTSGDSIAYSVDAQERGFGARAGGARSIPLRGLNAARRPDRNTIQASTAARGLARTLARELRRWPSSSSSNDR
ncbi:hypothetical protein BDZ88DRAFT_490821 [Geranomyces variabilis]|nr:hypothetical protein BDZ88DRAFT_490821 [Geranomyces variabilis]